jgi:hypothetical protein
MLVIQSLRVSNGTVEAVPNSTNLKYNSLRVGGNHRRYGRPVNKIYKNHKVYSDDPNDMSRDGRRIDKNAFKS